MSKKKDQTLEVELPKQSEVHEIEAKSPTFSRVMEGASLGTLLAQAKANKEMSSQQETLNKAVAEGNEQLAFDLARERGRGQKLLALKVKGGEQVSEILKKRDNFDSLKASDILYLGHSGVDLANLLLIPKDKALGSVNKNEIGTQGNTEFVVNFGKNKALNNNIGLGDIFPPEIRKVKVNGVEGIRSDIPRLGYYEITNDGKRKYLPIYDGDKVEAIGRFTLSKEQQAVENEAMERRFREKRIDDMVRAMWEKGDKWQDEFTLLPEDKDLIEAAKIEKENKEKRQAYREKMFGRVTGKETFLAYYSDVVNDATKGYGIPPSLLVKLIEKESAFNPKAMSSIGAYGLWQITNDTFELINKKLPDGIIQEKLDRDDPIDQIKAACVYLNYVRNYGSNSLGRQMSWAESVVLYHGGPAVENWNVPAMCAKNPGIAACLQGDMNAENYIKAARKYYELDAFEGAIWNALPPSTKSFEWDKFEGYPFERSSDTGTTMCSRTARFNANLFGVYVPQGESANKSRELYRYTDKQEFTGLDSIPKDQNVADIFVESHSAHGHRALAIRAKHDGQWYILDPYNNHEDARPFPASTYRKKILGAYGHKAVGPLAGMLA